MGIREIFTIILLVLLIICAIAVNLTRNLLQSVIIYMAYSSMMALVWILMESPDLGITEAAVGVGISGTLFLLTLKKIDKENDSNEGFVDWRSTGKSIRDESGNDVGKSHPDGSGKDSGNAGNSCAGGSGAEEI